MTTFTESLANSTPHSSLLAQQFDAEMLYAELARQCKAGLTGLENVAIVGIYSGGAWLAERLAVDCQIAAPVGLIDVSFYRDDFAQKGLHAETKPSHIPFAVDGATILLVDEVLYTGRTTRAAINELFDYGRPARILLASLVDRGGRELPYAPDFVAQTVHLPAHANLVLKQENIQGALANSSATTTRLVLTLIEKTSNT